MQDLHTAERQAFIRSVPRETSFDRKVSEAKHRLGEKYLFHPFNRVKSQGLPFGKA